MPGHHGCRGAREIHGSRRDILGLADAAEWDARDDALAPGRVLQRAARQLGGDEGGSHGVRGDAVARQLDREHLRQQDRPGLAGAVGRTLLDPNNASLRGYVDDAPTLATVRHVTGCGLRTEEGALEVRIQDGVPARLVDFENTLRDVQAGVVDQDVQASELGGDAVYTLPHRDRK